MNQISLAQGGVELAHKRTRKRGAESHVIYLPGDDLLARWGGDEFLVVQELEVDSALPTLERARLAIRGTPIGIRAGSISTSVSIGVVGWHAGQPLDEALAQADRALYRAKSEGGDVVLLGDL
mgnify:CR=1 FL=1